MILITYDKKMHFFHFNLALELHSSKSEFHIASKLWSGIDWLEYQQVDLCTLKG